MFNDRFGLTAAVLNGTKTVTRRIFTEQVYGELRIENNPCRIYEIQRGINSTCIKDHPSKYKVGEIIAISQRYKDIIHSERFNDLDIRNLEKSEGWNNKMFVKAVFMPDKIKITDVRLERLQDITDEDCIKEGVFYAPMQFPHAVELTAKWAYRGNCKRFDSPREAFASLIDKVGVKGTWDSNPFVYRYEFELIGQDKIF